MKLSPENDFLDILLETSEIKKTELFIQTLKKIGFDLYPINATSILNGNKDELIKFISNLFLWRPNLKPNSPQKKKRKENETISKKELDSNKISTDINKNENDLKDIFSKHSTPLENINENEHKNKNDNKNESKNNINTNKTNDNNENENEIKNQSQSDLINNNTLEDIFNSIETNEEPFSIPNIESTFSNDLFDDILKLTSEITIPIDKILDNDSDILKNPILNQNNQERSQIENESEFQIKEKEKEKEKKTKNNYIKRESKPNFNIDLDFESSTSSSSNITDLKNNLKKGQKLNTKSKSQNEKENQMEIILKSKTKPTVNDQNNQKSMKSFDITNSNHDLNLNIKKTNVLHSKPFNFINAKDPVLDLKRMSVMFGEGINFFEGLKREINNDILRFHSQNEEEGNDNKNENKINKESASVQKKKLLKSNKVSNKEEDKNINKEECDEKNNVNIQDNWLEISDNNKNNKKKRKKKKNDISQNKIIKNKRDFNEIYTTNSNNSTINNKDKKNIKNGNQKKNDKNDNINNVNIDFDNWVEISKPKLQKGHSKLKKTTHDSIRLRKSILPKKNIYQNKLQTNKFGEKIRKIGILKRKIHEKTLEANLLKLKFNQKKSKLKRITLLKELSSTFPNKILNHSFNLFLNQINLINQNSKEEFQKFLNSNYTLMIEYDQMKTFLIKIYAYFGISLRNINQNNVLSMKKKSELSNISDQNTVNQQNEKDKRKEEDGGKENKKMQHIKLNPNQKLIASSKYKSNNKTTVLDLNKRRGSLLVFNKNKNYQIEESNDIHLLKWVKKHLNQMQSNISPNYYSINILIDAFHSLLDSFLQFKRQLIEKQIFNQNNIINNNNDISYEAYKEKLKKENEIEQEKQKNRKILNYIKIKIQKFGLEKKLDYSELLIEVIDYLKKEKIIESNNSMLVPSITILFDSFGYSTLFYKTLTKLLIKKAILTHKLDKNLIKQKRLITKLITKFDYHFPSIFNYSEIKNEINSLFLQLNQNNNVDYNNNQKNKKNNNNYNDNDNNTNNAKDVISQCRKISLGKIIRIIVNRIVNKKIQILLKEYIEKNKNTELFQKLLKISKQIFGKYLLDQDLEYVISIFDPNNVREFIEPLSSDLFYLFESIGLSLPIIQVAISHEIERCKEPKYLFRSTDMATKLLMKYTKVYGEDFLKSSLKMMIVRLCSSDLDFEIDPFVISDEERLKQNLKNLNTHFVTLIEHMFQCVTKMPKGIKFICHFLQMKVKEKFGKSSLISVAGFIFLRWLCPAIVSPHNFEIVSFIPSERSRRGLVLLSSMAQNLASKTLFGETRAYMQPLNQTIIDFFDQRKLFLKQISNCEEYKLKNYIKKTLLKPISQKHYPDVSQGFKPEFSQLFLRNNNINQNNNDKKKKNNYNYYYKQNNFSILFSDLYTSIFEFANNNNLNHGNNKFSKENNDQIDLLSRQILLEQEYSNLLKFAIGNVKLQNLINKILSRKNIYQKKENNQMNLKKKGMDNNWNNYDDDDDDNENVNVNVNVNVNGNGNDNENTNTRLNNKNLNKKIFQKKKDLQIKVTKDPKGIIKSKSSPKLERVSFFDENFSVNSQKRKNKKISKKKRKEMKNNIKKMKKIKENELIRKWGEKIQKKIMFEGNGYSQKDRYKKKE
ncbi:ras gtpase-activating protein [Anaeramoeba flamelloides]|uniref:Ras gtpase-activating protein n=1 Tax=Anaeramoeba flamelloides TaxID=1746091 RepID=A0AAV8AF43_9EUKA|nr:ras gtpase-activating protein [Anaeramoeba flamelloides]